MTLAVDATNEPPVGVHLSRGALTALAVFAVTAVCLAVSGVAPWLGKWPTAWTLPATEWIGIVLTAAFEAIKPVARWVSWLLGFPLAGANVVLTSTPWPLVAGAILALALWVGGRSLGLLAAVSLLFILASGYWQESMATLSLVTVSVPLALSLGLVIGIIAAEVKAVRQAIEATLDVMQTVPTFAYLTPLLLLFGFGPVVGLIASAIYAAPPMARNMLLGLQRVDPEIREAALMSGSTRLQRLIQVEIPSASQQIMVGVNQCVMAALSMVIIAAVIGGFDDIGWEVLLTMRKAQFGQALLAGLVIVVFAILIDRISMRLANPRRQNDTTAAIVVAVGAGIIALGIAILWPAAATIDTLPIVSAAVTGVDEGLGAFTAANGAALDAVKNNAMFYGLLPLRIGLKQAVLPFTWGFGWTDAMTWWVYGVGALVAGLLLISGRLAAAVLVATMAIIAVNGVTNLPWPFVIGGLAAVAWHAGGRNLALFVVLALGAILVSGLWDRAMLSVYLCGAAVFACAILGGSLGLLAAVSPLVWRILRPICDMLQTIPLFVFLIPVLMFFQIGEFSAFLAICAYAIVPMIRYMRHGLTTTPVDLMEAAIASGATGLQILWSIRLPYAAPTILLGLNQTILYAFAMLVIAALIGTTGLGQSIYLALGQADIGLGVASGIAMALLALVADRLAQAFADERRKALGL